MLKTQDYKEFLNELYAIEKGMELEAEDLMSLIDDPDVRVLLMKLKEDEQRHAQIVMDLLNLLKSA